MDDRELLERAAKAAGRRVVWRNKMHQGEMREGLYDADTGIATHWNPLTDDGDALRLAVAIEKLNLLRLLDECGDPILYNADPYAATRRAIVRAAAEIGRSNATR